MSGYQSFFKNAKRSAEGKTAQPTFTPASKISSAPLHRDKPTRSAESLEQMIKNELQSRVKSKRVEKKLKKRKSASPAFTMVLLSFAMISGSAGYFASEYIPEFEMNLPFVQLSWSRANAADTKDTKKDEKQTEKKDSKKDEGKEKGKDDKAEKSAGSDKKSSEKSAVGKTGEKAEGSEKAEVDPSQWSSEEVSFFKKLSERKKQLDQRESELNKMEEELQKQRGELEIRIGQLEKMRGEISTILSDRVKQDQERVDKLVQVYSSMKAPQAAKLLEGINEDLAIEILNKMKKKSAADIMNVMDSKKVQKLSEMLVGYQRRTAAAQKSMEEDKK